LLLQILKKQNDRNEESKSLNNPLSKASGGIQNAE
jgi:hypothetical protein